jgi:L-cysteine desulfidase
MKRHDEQYNQYIQILKEELLPAMGCTEPIAIAYCASIVKEVLGGLPTDVKIYVSGNIIKNVKSVKVPNTNGKVGIRVAAAIGLVAGDAFKELEVIANSKEKDILKLESYMEQASITVYPVDNEHTLYIEIIGTLNDDVVKVIILDAHTNVYLVEKNNKVLYFNDKKVSNPVVTINKSVLNIHDIIEFANIVDINDIKDVLDRQIEYNLAIANEGINGNYGANIGKTIMKYANNDILTKCKAMAAAGSDARMNGCEMPVVINSGSGNQGITCSVPVITYAKHLNVSDELLYRALVVSNLTTIHIKNSIGKLSAFCGVVIAGAGCGAGIAYLEGGREREINHTIVNALGIISGVLCDGAKASCAAKIASSVEAGMLGYFMFKDGNQFISGDGFIKKGVENTIKAIGELARVGMCETDKEIIQLMMKD